MPLSANSGSRPVYLVKVIRFFPMTEKRILSIPTFLIKEAGREYPKAMSLKRQNEPSSSQRS